jgi:hypothetical protein
MKRKIDKIRVTTRRNKANLTPDEVYVLLTFFSSVWIIIISTAESNLHSFNVFTAVIFQIEIFSFVTPCSVAVRYQRFRGTRYFPEDESSMDIWNVFNLPKRYTASKPRRPRLETCKFPLEHLQPTESADNRYLLNSPQVFKCHLNKLNTPLLFIRKYVKLINLVHTRPSINVTKTTFAVCEFYGLFVVIQEMKKIHFYARKKPIIVFTKVSQLTSSGAI